MDFTMWHPQRYPQRTKRGGAKQEQAKMSVSAVLGSHLVPVGVAVKKPPAMTSFGRTYSAPWRGSTTGNGGGGGGLVIECSSRPQKKATAHHRKTRPRKTQLWDVKCKPTVYAPLPPFPAEWSLLSSADEAASASASYPEEPSSSE